MPHASAIWYSGSPLQLDFGEVADQKGALLVNAEPGRPASVSELPFVAGRRLMSLGGTFDEVVARADEVGDAYVRVVLQESARVGLADEVRDVFPNAVEVVLEATGSPILGAGDDDVVGDCRLDRDQAHAVGDDVVDVTGDTEAFLDLRLLGLDESCERRDGCKALARAFCIGIDIDPEALMKRSVKTMSGRDKKGRLVYPSRPRSRRQGVYPPQF